MFGCRARRTTSTSTSTLAAIGLAATAALALAACSSDSGSSDIPPELTERLSAAVERIEQADGLHLEMQILYYEGDGDDSASAGPVVEPDEATCVAATFEPAGTAASGERVHMNFGVPHEDFDNYGCLVGTSFTIDGTRVYAHTDEPAPGTEHGLLSRVGETTPELVEEMAALDTGSGAELAGLVESATAADEVGDGTVVFELDPERVADLAPPEAATDEPADAVTLTARYAPSSEEGDRLESLEYEITAGPSVVVMTYAYDRYDQGQGVEVPAAPYITPDVTRLDTLDELTAFVGLTPSGAAQATRAG